jgi:hypothetical protein
MAYIIEKLQLLDYQHLHAFHYIFEQMSLAYPNLVIAMVFVVYLVVILIKFTTWHTNTFLW